MPKLVVDMRMPVHIILLAAVSTDMKSRFACSRNGLPTRLPGWRAMSQHVTWCSVFDCYRPMRAVADFVRWSRDLTDVIGKAEFYPNVDKRTLFRDGYIASRSSHSRGSTVDLTLVHEDGRDQQGLELNMGTPFDFFSKRSWSPLRASAVKPGPTVPCWPQPCAVRVITRRNGGISRCWTRRPKPTLIF